MFVLVIVCLVAAEDGEGEPMERAATRLPAALADRVGPELLLKVMSDPQRPRYHAAPYAYYMGDPNGLIQVDGVYHLFYQHAPTLEPEMRMHWGHQRSVDLLHWEHMPIALYPDPYHDACSGSAVNDNGRVTAIYTGAEPQQQCIAFAEGEDLATLRPYEGNPVVAGPPEGLAVAGFRDPYVWREGDAWLMAVGSGIQGEGGALLLYASPDLVHWDYLHPLCTGDRETTHDMWECPSLVPLGRGKHLLAINALPLPVDWARMKAVCFVGTYADRRFTAERQADLDLFGEIWAPQIFRDDRGRNILMAMAWEARPWQQHGWGTCQTLPRVMALGEDGELRVDPIEEVETLRRTHRRLEGIAVGPDAVTLAPDTGGDALEVIAVFEPLSAHRDIPERFGVVVRRSPNGEEETRVGYDTVAGRVFADRSRASLDPEAQGGTRDDRGCLELDANAPITLRVFVDRSVLDVFVNRRAAGTLRIYPTRADSLGVGVFCEGGQALLRSLDVWTQGD